MKTPIINYLRTFSVMNKGLTIALIIEDYISYEL